MAVAETMQFLSTVAETPKLEVAVCATADVEARPRARNPRIAVDSADFTVFEYCIEVAPKVTKFVDIITPN
jgi:hypothetical protein